jgi:hypothetical protein
MASRANQAGTRDHSLAPTSAEPSASVRISPAECYEIRNGWAWAHIFVRHGTAPEMGRDGVRHWVHLSIISDYGEFGYCWSHIGEDWRRFLSGLDMHYAMNKMLGARFRVPLTIDEAEQYGRQTIIQYRREGSLDADDARKLWDGLTDADRDADLGTFLRDWDRCSEGRWYAHDWWDHRWDKVNPQAEGFWRDIWPHFVRELAQQAETPPQPTGDCTGGRTGCSVGPGTNQTPPPNLEGK